MAEQRECAITISTMKPRHSSHGFTIVELLIVIVVIAILAAIVITVYTGVSAKAQYSVERQDFASLQRVIELYKADKGYYPNSANCVNTPGQTNYQYSWCGYDQGQGDSFIPGTVPTYVAKLPTLDPSLPANNTYLYQSRDTSGNNPGTDQYQLIRFNPAGLSSAEKTNNPDLMTGSGYDGIAWGIRSNPSTPWW